MSPPTKRTTIAAFFGLLAAGMSSACSREAAGPAVSAPYAGALPPLSEAGVTRYRTPAETLFVHAASRETERRASILFYRGRGVGRDREGAAYVPDPQTSRVLVVDDRLRVVRVVGGPTEEGGGLGQPLAAAPLSSGGLLVSDTEHAEGLLYFDAAGDFAGSATPPVPNPDLHADPTGGLWAARSPYVIRFEETAADAPLLYRFDPLEGTGVGIAGLEPVDAGGWRRVANSGPVAVGPDGTGYFAFFLRNELRAYAPDGRLRWRTARDLQYPTPAPVFVAQEDRIQVDVRPVTQALALGPDGRLYALTVADSMPDLTAPARAAGERRIEVYDPGTGALLRASRVPASWTTFAADRDGRVFHVDPARVEATAPPPERAPLPDVPLVDFGGDTTRFADHRGKALLINFWASWCLPCQDELPKLDSYYRTLDRSAVEFLAISVDEDRDAAAEFIAPFRLPFPLFYGGPGMQEHFHYIGLPFTLIVDRRGRIVEEIHGFGSQETWNHLTSTLEAEMAVPGRDPAPGGEEAAGHAEHER